MRKLVIAKRSYLRGFLAMTKLGRSSASDMRKKRKDDAMEKKIVTPSQKSMTEGQINKAVARYRTLLERHAKNFDAEAVQTVLGQSEFANEQFAVFRRRVEMMSNFIVRHVCVDRSQQPQYVLRATGRRLFVNDEVVATMPRGEGEAEVVLFKPEPWEYTRPGFMSNEDLEKCYDRRSFVPADPYSVAGMNRDDQALADKYPHTTHWKDAKGKWCFATFRRGGVGRLLFVDRYGSEWDDGWWFAGLRKSRRSRTT
jgi:hypothetical protein